jgi:hypothetical protein
MEKTIEEKLIRETLEFYDKNPRGMDYNGICAYIITEDGRKCAVGRCLNEKALTVIDQQGLQSEMFRTLRHKLKNLMDESPFNNREYDNIHIDLWGALQLWHDDINRCNFHLDPNITEGRVTPKGHAEIEKILKEFVQYIKND